MAQPQRTSEIQARNYDRQHVVESFVRFVDISPCEKYLFEQFVPPGLRVLDLGVGAGRTTAFLAPSAREYVGIDYAPPMVEACRQRFPQYRFQVADAADLSQFEGASFDVVVFSFNGIDSLPTDSARQQCLRECHRVLNPHGTLIFSSHNPRHIIFLPKLRGIPLWKAAWRLIYSSGKTLQLTFRLLPTSVFFSGKGYAWEPADGGFRVHLATPPHVIAEINAAGFDLVEFVPHYYPARTGSLTTPWYYYVVRKRS